MNYQLKRVEPMRAANVGALVYGMLLACFALIMFPFVMMLSVVAPTQADGPSRMLFGLILLVYPIMGLVLGWISGFLTSVIYNFVVRWTGGILFEMDGPAAG